MDLGLTELLEQERETLRRYSEILGYISGKTERELLERVINQKRFEIETLNLLCTGKVPERFMAFGTISEDDVNFRDSPSPSSVVLTTLKRGTPVILTERRGNWIGVQLYDGRSGWVFKDYIKPSI